MTRDTAVAAKHKATQFLKTLAAVESVAANGWPLCGTKETGALRRASMELTRALAELRKP